MAKHLVVDGFNVIRRDPELSRIERANFLGAQETLIRHLARYRRGTAHRITVVFDGAGGDRPFRQRSQREGIEVVFSARGESADDVILGMTQAASGHQSGWVVVTADRSLAMACRTRQVGILPPEQLLRITRDSRGVPASPEFWHGKREENGWVGHTRKKGNPRRASKQQRRTRTLW
ncbi:MAG: NYN domain-containing protein [candidate division FCPU426 bacterium]